jgi:hypothetical protein
MHRPSDADPVEATAAEIVQLGEELREGRSVSNIDDSVGPQEIPRFRSK